MSQPLVNDCDYSFTPPPSYKVAVGEQEQSYPGQGQDDTLPHVTVLVMPTVVHDASRGYSLMYNNGQETEEYADPRFGASLSNKSVRALFVRKVYGILMLQFLVTVAIVCWFIFHEPTKQYFIDNAAALASAYIVFLVVYIVLVCCKEIRRTWPCNIILLSIYTLAMSLMAAVMSLQTDTYIVLLSIGIVAVVCFSITLFSMQTKWDITGKGIYLFVFSLVVFKFGILMLVLRYTTDVPLMSTVYSGLAAIVIIMYLVYDTQLIVGGRELELSPEEYIYAALRLYSDVVNLFIILVGAGRRK